MSYISNPKSTEELQDIDFKHHFHPFTATSDLKDRGARIVTRAKGVYLSDSEGKRYLDAMAGLWCVNIGYGRKELAEAAYRQMKELPYYNTFFQTSHPPVIELAETLAKLLPGNMKKIFFSSSGSEANDTNIRLVRHYWQSLGKPNKTTIISRKNSYHGSSVGSASLGGMQAMHAQGCLPIPDICHINQPYWYGEGRDYSSEDFGIARARELEEKINKIGEEKVAAFIAEPIQGAGGVIIPPKTYWPEIKRICKKYEILLIVDEVICAFGRTGKWFGCDTYDIAPDIMTIAKGLSSGYQPIGGSAISEKVSNVFDDLGGEFSHGYTYSGHPVAAAVALENLRILKEEKIIENVEKNSSSYIKSKWEELAEHPMVGEARIQGMMGAIELSPDKNNKTPFRAPPGTAGLRTREICFENGLIMRHVYDRMIISPPLIIKESEIDELISLARKCLDLSMKQLKQEGLWS